LVLARFRPKLGFVLHPQDYLLPISLTSSLRPHWENRSSHVV